MKKRQGFVSNSSSSSFVVALDKDDYKVKVTIKLDLSKYGDVIDSHDKLVEHLTKEYVCGSSTFEKELEEEPYMRELYEKGSKALKEGRVVIFGCFSSEDYGEGAFLCEKGLRGLVDESKVEIIRSEGGY